MPSFPTTLIGARNLINSWGSLGVWPNESEPQTDKEHQEGSATSKTPFYSPDSQVSPSDHSLAGQLRPSETSNLSADSTHAVKIVPPLAHDSGRGATDSQERGSTKAGDPRRLSVISTVTERSIEGLPRRRVPLDTYVIVKPPSTAAKNPLNLQIQLVVRPSGRPRNPSPSADSQSLLVASDRETSAATTPVGSFAEETTATPMMRSHSDGSRSDASRSDFHSGPRTNRAGSIKSTTSAETNTSSLTGGAKKRVEPMFNLTIHNVMQPTVVTDAATDAKVAKFMKRSVDILGVGTVEPTEIWSPVPREGLQRPLSATGGLHSDIDSSGSAQIATLQKRSPAAEHQGEAERGSVTASGSLRQSLDSASLSIDTRRQERTSRNFLGRIFKKRGGDQEVVTSPGVDSKNCKAEDISSNRSAKKRAPRSLSPNPAVMIQPTLSDASKDESVHLPVSIGQPTFGTTPSIQSADRACAIVTESGAVGGLTSLALPPPIDSRAPNGKNVGGTQYFSLCQSSRPVGYSWKISKWSKKRLEKWIRQLGGSGGNTLLQTAEGGVVFEWVKLRMPQDALNGALSRKLAQAGAQPTVVIGNQPGSNRKTPTAPLTPSFSLDAETREAASVSPSEVEDDAGSHTSRSNSHVGSASIDQPDGSLSDHTIDSGDESEPEDSETPWTCSVWIKRTGLRIPLATLTPAPHHPKVIGVLKIPTELDLVRLGFGADAVERRSLEAIGLSEENVKDVVCVTAMWLVAREEFGGLGKKRRGSKI